MRSPRAAYLIAAPLAVTMLLPAGLSAAKTEDRTATINATYKQIHEDVCACKTGLNDNEKWAFVATWCARHPTDHGKVDCAGLPKSGGPVVLAFDHDGRVWRAIRGVAEADITRDANGIPRVLTSSGRTVIAVVESTNPLVYKAEAGAITETDAAVVGDLRKLFEKLGPVVAGALPPPPPFPITREVTPTPAPEDEALRNLQDAAKSIRECIPDQWLAARDFTQHVEDREHAKYQVLAPNCPTGPASLQEKLKKVRAAVAALEEKREKDERENKEEKGKDKQKTEKEEKRESTLTRAEASALDAANALLTPAKEAELETVIESVKRFDRRLLDSVAAATEPVTKGEFTTADVADFFVVRQGAIAVAWTSNRTRALTVTKASPFDKLSANRPDNVATSYGAASLTASLIDVNVALTYTPLASPVFGMVSEPAPTAADPNAKQNVIGQTNEESRAGKFAVLVSLPVFLRLTDSPWSRRFGLELGAGASTSTPALFLGLTAKLGGGVRLGVGMTRQQVKALNGQALGDPIAAAGDIKVKNDWDNKYYASLSLSLKGIGSLFTAP